MEPIDLNSSIHKFEKQNLISLKDNKGIYDRWYKCVYCRLEGKRYILNNKIYVDITLKKVKTCDGKQHSITNKIVDTINTSIKSNKKVKITQDLCVFGAKNLNKGNIVEVIESSSRGVWVKGEEVTEAMKKLDSSYNGLVLLLTHEFEFIE